MSDVYDDLEEFGAFDAAISGGVRDPFPEFARMRSEEPIQRMDIPSMLPGEEGKPCLLYTSPSPRDRS